MSAPVVPFQDLRAAHAPLGAALDEAFRRVRESGWYVLGPEVVAFEAEFGRWLGVEHAVSCANGTDAIALALASVGVGPGDDVLTTAVSAFPTVTAILMRGARPVFADVVADTGLVDLARAERRLTPATRAFIPVHLYGQAVDGAALQAFAARHPEVAVVEDCAQGHGARSHGRHVGGFGRLAAFSFYPTKNLGALGDGGLVATSDPTLADRLRRLRNYGQSDRYHHDEPGWNSRLDELQAALLRVKLAHLDGEIARRRAVGRRYLEELGRSACRPLQWSRPDQAGFHLFPVLTDRRDDLQAHLRRAGVETLIHYPVPCHRQRALGAEVGRDACPASDQFCAQVLSLPMHGGLSEQQVDTVIAAVLSFAPA